MRILNTCCLIVLTACAGQLLAADAKGVITAVDASSITIAVKAKAEAPAEKTFTIDDATVIMVGKEEGDVYGLKAGDEATVTHDDEMLASQITVKPAKAAKGDKKPKEKKAKPADAEEGEEGGDYGGDGMDE